MYEVILDWAKQTCERERQKFFVDRNKELMDYCFKIIDDYSKLPKLPQELLEGCYQENMFI